jgi:hypothetical protein
MYCSTHYSLSTHQPIHYCILLCISNTTEYLLPSRPDTSINHMNRLHRLIGYNEIIFFGMETKWTWGSIGLNCKRMKVMANNMMQSKWMFCESVLGWRFCYIGCICRNRDFAKIFAGIIKIIFSWFNSLATHAHLTRISLASHAHLTCISHVFSRAQNKQSDRNSKP